MDEIKLHNQLRDLNVSSVMIIANKLGLPLFILFWFVDIICYPEQKFTFILIRLLVIFASVVVTFSGKKITTYLQSEILTIFVVSVYSLILNWIIYLIDDYTTYYYAGLNLLALGTIPFLTSRVWAIVVINAVIFVPYMIVGVLSATTTNYQIITANFSFVVGSIVAANTIYFNNMLLRKRDFRSSSDLKSELESREEIISTQTKKNVRLQKLSSQFSPQIVQKIAKGEIKVSKGLSKSQICAVFIDIVGSTEKLEKLNHLDFNKVVNRFMEISVKTFLKFDLTIDKFYGDGILAYSNNPVKRKDFVERTIASTREIKWKVQSESDFFTKNWQGEIELTSGIATGEASLGFFGDSNYLNQYSAVGVCLALARRLSSLSTPGEILICETTFDLSIDKGSYKQKGSFNLKGLEKEQLVYEVPSVDKIEIHTESCFSCKSSSVFLDEQDGIYVLRCRSCNVLQGGFEEKNNLIAS